MGEEVLNVEGERALVRDWVSEYYGQIERVLTDHLDRTYSGLAAQYTSGNRATILRENDLVDDPFSNRFCGVWVLDLPQGILGPMQQIGVNYFRERTVRFRRPDGKSDERGHVWLGFGRIIADAVFGQFTDLDRAASLRPKLFVKRVFVGTKQEADSAFRVEYK